MIPDFGILIPSISERAADGEVRTRNVMDCPLRGLGLSSGATCN